MEINRAKTMQYILSELQDFNKANLAKMYYTNISVQRYIDGHICIEALFVEQYSETLVEQSFVFKSEAKDWELDVEFDRLRAYIHDYNSRNH